MAVAGSSVAGRKPVVVMGYASVDRAMTVDPPIQAGSTSMVQSPTDRMVNQLPPGGIGYTVRAVAASGVAAEAISWVGDDADGRVFTDALAAAGAGVTGIAVAGTTTPASLLIYDVTGNATCLFNPGDSRDAALTDSQRDLLRRAGHVMIMVGPQPATSATLEVLRGDVSVSVVLKLDRSSQPDRLLTALLNRAQLVFCNQVEFAALDGVLSRHTQDEEPRSIVCTAGAGDVRVIAADGSVIEVEQPHRFSQLRDFTGAGDTLAGATVGAFLQGASLHDAARHGIEATARLLSQRIQADV